MKEFLLSAPTQAVIWTTVLVILVIVGWYVTGRFRDRTEENRLSPNDLLTNFRELHQRGGINDAEFRTIKTVLGAKLQEELKDREGKG